jgi:hypothetical protein
MLGRGACLVEEEKGVRVHGALPHAPALATRGNIGRSCSAALSAYFLCDRPSRRSVAQIVDNEPDL